MQTANTNTGDMLLDLLVCILALLPIMMPLLAVLAVRRNERMNMRIGLEIEAIKKAHIRESPHEKLAVWVAKRDELVRSLMSSRTRRKLDAIRVQYAGYTHEVMTHTKIVTDSSLSRGGFEIVSPPLNGRQKVMSWISRICSHLRGVAEVDRSCGLHVHVGLKDYGSSVNPIEMGFEPDLAGNWQGRPEHYGKAVTGRVAWAYGYFQGPINLMVSESRRNGEWSRDVKYISERYPNPSVISVRKRVWNDDREQYEATIAKEVSPLKIGLQFYDTLYEGNPSYGDSRYQCVNPQSFPKYGTIEFRAHQGTTNATKIQNWVQFLHLFTQRCASNYWTDITEFNGDSIHDLFTWLGLADDDPLYVAMVRRIKALNGNHPSVFRNDPILAHNSLFKESIVCSGCGSASCDSDEQCGTNYTAELMTETENHFLNLDRSCDTCGTHLRETESNQRYDYGDHHEAHCPNCGDMRVFNAMGGVILSIMLGTLPLALVIVGCGIGAVHAAAKSFKSKRLATKLFKRLADRGKQASGFAFENGKGVFYVKAPHSSIAMAHHVPKQLRKSTIWTMMHTRFATHGDNNKANAHPHFGRLALVTLVHNGVVHNYDKVWMALGTKPTGPVDSQAVAQCLEVGGIEKVVELCEGSMSLIWSDVRDAKGTLKCWTNGGNPLVMGRLDDANNGPVVIASTEKLLKEGCGSRLKTHWDCTIGREYTISPSGAITKRDIDGSAETAGVVYDWRTYYDYTPYKITKGKNTGKNYTVVKSTTGSRTLPYRIKQLAQRELERLGSWAPIEGKWDGFDLLTFSGIYCDKWGANGEPLTYDLPQYINPAHYRSDMEEILLGSHRPECRDSCTYDAP
jgi:hypothetical protein